MGGHDRGGFDVMHSNMSGSRATAWGAEDPATGYYGSE